MADKQSYSYQHSTQSSALVRELKQRTDGVTAAMQSRTSVTSSSTTLTSSSIDASNLARIYSSAMDDFTEDSRFFSSELDVEEYGSLLDNSAAKHKMAIRPRKRHSESRHFSPAGRSGGDDSSSNVTDADDGVKKSRADELHAPRQQIYQRSRSGRLASVDPHAKREAVIRELVETEEEFVTDMQHVVDKYYCQMDHPSTPRPVSNQRDAIFGPFKQIQDFHKSVLLEGLKYYANEPDKIGRTFLRLERDFDKHAQYYADEPKAQELLREDKVIKEFFEQYSHSINDTKHIGEYLKLPIQRINDFQVLLQDLITHSVELCEDTGDLLKAHEFMLGLPQRKADASLIENISGYRGNLHKLGRLLRQEWFTVTDSRGRARDRYLFLFKARILVTKVRRVTDDRNLFLLKDIIKLPDVEVNEKEGDPPNFDLIHCDPRLVRYPLNLRAIPGRPVHQDWLTEIRKYAADVVALQEHAEDDLQVDGLSDTDTDDYDVLDEPLPAKDSAQIAKNIKDILRQKNLNLPARNPSADPAAPGPKSPQFNLSPEPKSPFFKPLSGNSEASVQSPESNKTDTSSASASPSLIPAGDKTVLDCALETDDPSVTLTWLHNNRPLDDRFADRIKVTNQGRSKQLHLMNCRVEDSGLYSAMATNVNGTTSCSAPLIVKELTDEEREKMARQNSPVFLVTLHDTELIEGTSVRFMVKVKGDPIPGVEFFKDDVPLESTDRLKLVNDQSATGFYELMIAGVTPEDAGRYRCNALNRFGEIKCEADVTVTNEKSVFKLMNQQSLLEPGEKPVFEWYKDGAPFDPEERFKCSFQDEEDTLALVFSHVKPEDAGLYTCVAATCGGKVSCSAELTVQGAVHHLLREPEPPSVVMELADTEVNAGGSAMLELKIKGFPKPKLCWTHAEETEPIAAGGRYRFLYEDEESAALIIKNVEQKDAGLYKVVATNDLGEVTTQGHLLVKAPPKFKNKMQDMACMTEQPCKVQVNIEGSPTPELKWYKDGQIIIESERIKMVKESDETFALIIERVKIEDSGSYSVVASNAMGQMSEFWQMVANAPPTFLQQLIKESQANEGENITFEVKVEGNPAPTLKWCKDGKELKHDGKGVVIKQDGAVHSLTLNGVKRGDTGKYSCVVTNAHGVNEDTSDFRVRTPPEIRQMLRDIDAHEGQTDVVFTVLAEAYPPPKVRWYIGDMEITEERKEFVRSSDPETGKYTLTVKDVQKETAGKYVVQFSNDLGNAKSSANLKVMYAPKLETQLRESINIEEGKTAVLSMKCCGLPEPTVKWLKDGVEIGSVPRLKIKTEGNAHSLTLEKSVASDNGVYEAVVTNSLGEARTKCTVNVDSKPKIISDNLVAKETYEEEQVVYTVTASGRPHPEAQWTKDGKVLEQSERIEMSETEETYTMTIKSTTMTDAGKYAIKLTNRLGSEAKSADLTVKSLAELRVPKILQELTDTTASKGTQVEFKARIRGQPTPNVQWFRNDEPLANDNECIMTCDEVENSYTLIIPKATEDHEGIYTVKATNEHGTGESSASLTIVMKPELTHDEEVTVEYYEETNIEVFMVASPKPKVKWTKDGVQLTTGERIRIKADTTTSTYSLKIKETQLEDAGVYSLIATNKEGETTGQIKLNVHTEAPSFAKKPKSNYCSEGETAKFHVVVKGVPAPTISWSKNGEPLQESDHIKTESKKEGKYNLIVSDIQESDYAEYTVTAVNMMGEASATAELCVPAVAPELTEALPGQTKISEGETLKLTAKISGSPLPKVKWYKNGEEIVPDEKISMQVLPDGTAVLKVANALPHDSGTYKMVAENVSGKVTSQTCADVQKLPKKGSIDTELPASAKATEGKPLKLTAKISGHPEPVVKWMKDGRPIRAGRVLLSALPDGTVSLEIDSCKPEDAGRYTLSVSNDLGESTMDTAVEIEPPVSVPEFVTPLSSGKATEGFPVKMAAKVNGYPAPEIQWMKDGKKFKPDKSRVTLSKKPEADGTVEMIFKETLPEDAGEYAVVARNPEGETTSSAPLSVRPRMAEGPATAPIFLTPPRDVSVDEGNPFQLSCVISGNPIPDVQWTLNGEPIDPSHAVVNFDGDRVTLNVAHALKSDEGEYQMTLVNDAGVQSAKAKAAVRKIYQPPSFTQKFSDVQQLPTYDAKLLGRVTGVPKPTVAWTFNGQPLQDSDKYKIKRDGDICALFIRDCNADRAGRYACIATNSEGEDRCEANLEVVDKIEKKEKEQLPHFLKKIGDCEVYEGMTAKFTACASGFPEPDYHWFRNGQRLFANDRIRMEREGSGLLRLTIRNVDESDVGQYSLRVFNPHGEARCSADLCYDTLDSRPKRPLGDQYTDFEEFRMSGAPVPLADRPIINLITDRYLTLSWKPSIPIGPRIPVTYEVEMCESPDGDWETIRSGIRGCCCDIRNLDPFRDYRFRIRVANQYGVSDPSPYNSTNRDKLYMEPVTRRTYLEPGAVFNPDTSYYFPKDYDLERIPHDGYSHAPRFLRQETEAQYGVKNLSANLYWYVYGYPKPTVEFFFNDEPIEMGGRFAFSYTRNGQLTLFVNRMLDRDVGVYEAVATNEHGQARQRVQLAIAEHPRFIQRPEETIFVTRKPGRLECRIESNPEAEVKWYKDWLPLGPSSRIRMQHILPDSYVLTINDVITKDEGLYSVVARNPAGSITASAMVHVEENEEQQAYLTYRRGRNVKPRGKDLSDFYDVGDEIGRGTQGITNHCVERSSGNSYVVKTMTGTGDLRARMHNELDMMNLLNHKRLIRLMDAFENPKSMSLVTEYASGGDLMDVLVRRPHITESDIANYIRQVLEGLEYMHNRGVAHLGLTPGDIYFSRPDGDDIKIGDFGLARRIFDNKLAALNYGMPEFVAPETANGEGVGLPADMWSVGVITYLLLSGISPFRGDTDSDTLRNVQAGQINFDPDAFKNITADAKDFIAKLLLFSADTRLTVRQALDHPWLKRALMPTTNDYRIATDRLKNYYGRYGDWYGNASCRTWYRLRPLSGAFTHPSRMVYPPGEEYTPRSSPEPRRKAPFEPTVTHENSAFEYPGYDTDIVSSESQYQYGPDTYLLQLRDVDFPVRLRQYMKVASSRSPSFAVRMSESNFDHRLPSIHERRRFTDIMDEEIDDERKSRIYQRYSTNEPYQYYQPRRLKHELGTRPDVHSEAEAILEIKRDGMAPFLREKPKTVAMVLNQTAQFSCMAVGDPQPVIQWYKNDVLIMPGQRISVQENENGSSILKIESTALFDCGVYKVVARNKSGQTVAKARLVMGDTPSVPDSPEWPETSDTEILLRWKVPRSDGNSPVLCYSLQQKFADATDWVELADNIDHEFFLVRNLTPRTEYQFRLAARNKFGWSDRSIPTKRIMTKSTGSPKVLITRAMKYLQQLTESGQVITSPEDCSAPMDYTMETEPPSVNEGSPTDEFTFIAEISRGRFSLVAKCAHKVHSKMFAAKIVVKDDQSTQELATLRTLCHERIAALHKAYVYDDLYVFIMEKLQGMDVLTYLSQRHEYTEQMVASIITQILDGLQYLHWRGIAHLDLQPDNVLLTSTRSLDVKLCDMGSAQRVSKLGTLVQCPHALQAYTAPEILNEEPAFPQSDIWSLGVMTYVLLSGVSPFSGKTDDETRLNITYVRYQFEPLYKEISMEATRFLMLLFKRCPGKRPSAEESLEHRWLQPSEHMLKKRERASFFGNRLKEYTEEYHKQRRLVSTTPENILSSFGLGLSRSNSNQTDIFTAY